MSPIGNLQLTVGKVQLSAPPTVLTHDAAGFTICISVKRAFITYSS